MSQSNTHIGPKAEITQMSFNEWKNKIWFVYKMNIRK